MTQPHIGIHGKGAALLRIHGDNLAASTIDISHYAFERACGSAPPRIMLLQSASCS